jgi:hypothetical protein
MSQSNAGVFQIYRRGFLGKPVQGAEKASINSTIMKQLKNLQYNQTAYLSDDKNHVYNEDVEVLYSQYCKKSVHTGSFEFHELILDAAIFAFGTDKFINWIDVQSKSPSATYIHSKFLLDTMRFIETGKREMVVENWEPLLNSHAISGEWEEVLDDAIALNKKIPITEVRDVIRYWCQQPNGISDLLVTLHILFGR